MDFIEKALNIMNDQSKRTRIGSGQLTLGKLIKRLESCEKNVEVGYDFADTFPSYLESWRGSYAELALGYNNSGEHPKRDDLLAKLKDAIGKTFTGWKGGDFTMDENTPVWVANAGSSGSTAIVDVLDLGYWIVIRTDYREF